MRTEPTVHGTLPPFAWTVRQRLYWVGFVLLNAQLAELEVAEHAHDCVVRLRMRSTFLATSARLAPSALVGMVCGMPCAC